MISIHLFTRDSEHVAAVQIPPFKSLPDVITWDTRTFTLWVERTGAERIAYREAFGFTIPASHDLNERDMFPAARTRGGAGQEYTMMDMFRMARKLHDVGHIDDAKYEKLLDAWCMIFELTIK